MPRGRPKKKVTATKSRGLAPSLMPRLPSTNNEGNLNTSSIEPFTVAHRRRGRPRKHPKPEEPSPEDPAEKGYDADVSNLTAVGPDVASDAIANLTTAPDEAVVSNITAVGPDVAIDVTVNLTTAPDEAVISNVASDVIAAPITTRDEAITATASLEVANGVVVAPTPIKRPRGIPPKKSKAEASATAPTAAPVTSTPAGRGRGRPPRNASGKATSSGSKLVADKNEGGESSDESHAVQFSLDNLVGSYTVECPKIQETWPDDSEDGAYEYTLDISPADDGDKMLATSFNFSQITGIMRIALSKSQLESFLREQRLQEQASVCPHSSQPCECNEERIPATELDNDRENNENADNIDDYLTATGEKRKAVDNAEPVKRGRGRPPKKVKLAQAPTSPLPSKVFFAYRIKADLGYGDAFFESRFGSIQPQENSCKQIKGVFDTMPIIDELIGFSARKVNDKPENKAEPWISYKSTSN